MDRELLVVIVRAEAHSEPHEMLFELQTSTPLPQLIAGGVDRAQQDRGRAECTVRTEGDIVPVHDSESRATLSGGSLWGGNFPTRTAIHDIGLLPTRLATAATHGCVNSLRLITGSIRPFAF